MPTWTADPQASPLPPDDFDPCAELRAYLPAPIDLTPTPLPKPRLPRPGVHSVRQRPA